MLPFYRTRVEWLPELRLHSQALGVKCLERASARALDIYIPDLRNLPDLGTAVGTSCVLVATGTNCLLKTSGICGSLRPLDFSLDGPKRQQWQQRLLQLRRQQKQRDLRR